MIGIVRSPTMTGRRTIATAKKAAKKTVKKTAAKKAARPLSADIEPAKALLTPAKVEVGKKRIIKKPARDDAPF